MPCIQIYDWLSTIDASILNLCSATIARREERTESDMRANSHDVKFTDDLEREMIQREIDDMNEFVGHTTEPLLKWALAIAITLGTLLIVIFHGH